MTCLISIATLFFENDYPIFIIYLNAIQFNPFRNEWFIIWIEISFQ